MIHYNAARNDIKTFETFNFDLSLNSYEGHRINTFNDENIRNKFDIEA